MCLHIYDTLISLDEDNDLVPTVAESWEQLDDVTYKFHLRKGVKFHNGRECTSDDVKFSFERMLKDPEAPYYFDSNIEGVAPSPCSSERTVTCAISGSYSQSFLPSATMVGAYGCW